MGRTMDHLLAQVIPKKGSKENPIDLDHFDDVFGAPGSKKRQELLTKKPSPPPIPDVYITRSRPARSKNNTTSAQPGTQNNHPGSGIGQKAQAPPSGQRTTLATAAKSSKTGSALPKKPATPKPKSRKAPGNSVQKRVRPTDQLKYRPRVMDHLLARVTGNDFDADDDRLER
ncbi:hypothetical protein M434DRAFT_16538 [Hypoxylon sp. CO27-5]|nr:hypothetical protein M434DRAFT_16538 [Hypoxylon sp. CO27-5]